MGSVVFDFDSTLVACESLAEACAAAPGVDGEARTRIERITDAAMAGEMDFGDALRRRLALAPVRRSDLTALGARLAADPTRGARELVEKLARRGHEVWIVSGAFREVLLGVAAALGVPPERTWGVGATWNPDGSLRALSTEDGFCESKLEGVRRRGIVFARPAVGVGDGATDLALCVAGAVDHFVAYTEHVRRAPVVAGARHEARDMGELEDVLEDLLG